MMETNIHASCVAVGRQGVLLLGESGAGKSDLALRLIDDGATLVADDRTILFAKRGALYARPPVEIAELIEVRGVGIVARSFARSARIALVVRLGAEGARLPERQTFTVPPGLIIAQPPLQIALNPHFAGTPAKIRAALNALSCAGFRDNMP